MLSFLPESITAFGRDMDAVMYLIYYLVGAWFFLAEFVLLYFIVAGRKKEGVRAAWLPADTPKMMAFVLVPTLFVIACDFIIEVAADKVWHEIKIEMPEPELNVGVTASQFRWIFNYPGEDGELWTADDIIAPKFHAPAHRVVRFELQSEDVLHSFFVRELRLKQDIIPGRSIPAWFKAEKAGEYELACAEICGKGHTLMRSHLVVHEGGEFDAWLREQSE